ncbi:hypothetical protein SISNIDRAFT_486659 [Sistotremastrum niveocremeum HHB9708]|uniref:Uncharacterized protein n=1 Tax=Sistotremastrum niveocremeum HHB9708 TaxID=1314777 RepID=A0A164T6T6_9AGAM|nr:hypothetical protein SISNIDRAFT_486659 [Sistotremastrum niveocremeum HHB9708]
MNDGSGMEQFGSNIHPLCPDDGFDVVEKTGHLAHPGVSSCQDRENVPSSNRPTASLDSPHMNAEAGHQHTIILAGDSMRDEPTQYNESLDYPAMTSAFTDPTFRSSSDDRLLGTVPQASQPTYSGTIPRDSMDIPSPPDQEFSQLVNCDNQPPDKPPMTGEQLAMQALRDAFEPEVNLPEDEDEFLAFVAQRIRELTGHAVLSRARL